MTKAGRDGRVVAWLKRIAFNYRSCTSGYSTPRQAPGSRRVEAILNPAGSAKVPRARRAKRHNNNGEGGYETHLADDSGSDRDWRDRTGAVGSRRAAQDTGRLGGDPGSLGAADRGTG